MGYPLDITGQKYGLLTAVESVGKGAHSCYNWLVQCECGKQRIVSMGHLRSGNVKSCGCLLKASFIDITGQRFGRLTAVRQLTDGSRKRKAKWLFQCDCGKEVVSTANAVHTGNTQSCGCLKSEKALSRCMDYIGLAQAACITHGRTGSRIYKIYKGMKQRCYNDKNPNYKYYGGKGVMMCAEWMNDPTRFFDWALANGYTDKLTIDRIDSDGDYCPDNCRFITQSEQARLAVIVREQNRRRIKNDKASRLPRKNYC